MKTRDDVQRLKENWVADPCCDIYDTEGFEEYFEELKNYQKEMEVFWEREEQRLIEEKAVELGLPGNIKIARYIKVLEKRLDALEGEDGLRKSAWIWGSDRK